MSDLSELLEKHGQTTLTHVGPDFDETKVKRDGGGKFAKKADASGLTDGKDADWMKWDNLNGKLGDIAKAAGPAFSEAVRAVLDKYDLESRADLDNNPKAREEAAKAGVQILNNYAENRGVSPSGQGKIQYRIGNHGKIIAGVVTPKGYVVIPKRGAETSLRLSNSAPEVKAPAKAAASPPRTPPRTPPREPAKGTASPPRTPAKTTEGRPVTTTAEKILARKRKNRFKFDPNKARKEAKSLLDELLHEDADGDPVGDFLESQADVLLHNATAGPTVQDVVDSMSQADRDVMDIVIGAAVEDEDISDPEIIRLYDNLDPQYKNIIDFIVGGVLSSGSEAAHSEDTGDFLEHFGVKGMRWGFRKSEGTSALRLSKTDLNTSEGRKAARAAVKSGSATLGDAHLAGLKSTGHRVANAFLGDKTYWKKAAIITGATAVAAGATFATAGLLPASVLSTVGAHAIGGTAVTVAGKTALVTSGGTIVGPAALAAAGQQAIIGAGLVLTQTVTGVANIQNTVTNTVRAVRGNARINNSYAALGKRIHEQQTAGTERVNKILRRDGSLRKKDLQHDDEDFVFLAHHGIKGMKWGVRRTDAQLGRVARLRKALSRTKDDDDDTPKAKSSGSSDKKDDDGPDKPTVKGGSADHEAMMESLSKDVEGMTTRELQEVNNRAQALQNYQRLFAPAGGGADSKSPLEKQVAEMNLQKQYNQLKAELTPERRSMVSKLAEKAGQGYDMYGKIDKAVGGDLSKALSRKLGLEPPPSPSEQAKLRTEMAKASKAEADARGAIAGSARKVQTDTIFKIEESVLKQDILRGDLPSQAAGYTAAGKRRAVGNFNDKGKFTPTEGGARVSRPTSTSSVPVLSDLISTVQKAPAYKPSHRAPTGLELLKSQLGTKRGGNNPGFPVIPPSRIGSKKHRRD